MTELNESVRSLEQRIALFSPRENVLPMQHEIDQATHWNAWTFLYKVLNECTVDVLRASDLSALVTEFKNETGRQVQVEPLVAKGWLRSVIGYVELPPAIRSHILQFDKISNKIAQLRFILMLPVNDQRMISKAEVDNQLGQTGIALDFHDPVIREYILPAENGQYKIAHPAYYEHFVLVENDFAFLSYCYQKLNRVKGIFLPRGLFAKLHAEHKAYFPLTPAIQALIDGRLIAEAPNDAYEVGHSSIWENFGQHTLSALWLDNPVPANLPRWIDLLFSQGWTRTATFSMSNEEREPLLDLLLNMIRAEPDLEPLDKEIEKVILDSSSDLHTLNLTDRRYVALTFDTTESVYAQFEKMEFLSDQLNSDIFYRQDSRKDLRRIIRIILSNDGYYKNQHYYYSKQLLALNHPAILFAFYENVKAGFSHLLPELLIIPRYAPFALRTVAELPVPARLVSTIQNDSVARQEVITVLWDECLDIISRRIAGEFRRLNPDISSIADMTYEVLLIFARTRFKSVRERAFRIFFKGSDSFHRSSDKIIHTLAESPYSHAIAQRIFKLTVDAKFLQRENIVNVPLLHLELLTNILNLVESSGPHVKKDSFETEVLEHLGQLFTGFFTSRVIANDDRLFGYQKFIDRISLGTITNVLIRHHAEYKILVIPDFTPSAELLTLGIDRGRHLASTIFQVYRIRAYFELLSAVYRHPAVQTNTRLRDAIEQHYVELIDRFSIDDIKANKINVFHHSSETGMRFEGNVLPGLTYNLNLFHNTKLRKEIVSKVARAISLHRLIEMWHYLISSGDRALVFQHVQGDELQRIITNNSWVDAIELPLKILGWENVLQKEMEAVIRMLEARTDGRGVATVLQLRLFQYYHANDLDAVRNLSIPENTPNVDPQGFFAERSLFESLILTLRGQYEESNEILKRLHARNPRAVYVANIFANEIESAKREINDQYRKGILMKAFDKWEKEKKSLRKENKEVDLDALQPQNWYNELEAYSILENPDAFEKLYRSIPVYYRLDRSLLEIRVNMLITQERNLEAEQLINQARTYHRQDNEEIPEFLKTLISRVRSTDYLDRLRQSYQFIIARPAEDLIRLIPPKINNHSNNLTEFLTFEIEFALLTLVKWMRSLNQITAETKYNDLLSALLLARLSMIDWTVRDNPSGNISGSKVNAGERDLVLSSNGQDIAVIECLHIKPGTFKPVREHLQKVFTYSECIVTRFVIGYCKPARKTFDQLWADYKQKAFATTKFQSPYTPSSTTITSLESSSEALVIGKSIHGKHELIHILVNLNFNEKLPDSTTAPVTTS